MSLLPGQEVGPARTTAVPDPDDALAAGDLAAIGADGNAEPADSEVHDASVGVRGRGIKAGDEATFAWNGPVVASVAPGVAAGASLDQGNATDGTAGQLVADAGGDVLALSDEGGRYRDAGGAGFTAPDGYAVVLLR